MRDSSLHNELDSTAPLLDQFEGQTTPCRGGESSGFYAFPSTANELDRSKAICQGCKFRRDCLRHASKNEETGVWGGKYFFEGRVRNGESAFLGRRSVRTQTDEEMFEEVYLPIPIDKLDAFNAGEWEPPYVEGYEYEDGDEASDDAAEEAFEDSFNQDQSA